MRLTKIIFILTFITAFSLDAYARYGAAPEGWPCIQPYVAEVSAGAFWSGVLPDSAELQNHEAIIRLAEEVSDRTIDYQQSSDKVGVFLQQLAADSPEQKRAQTELLVVALTNAINEKRHQVMRGIKRFAERQQMMITRIGEQDNKIRAAQDDDSVSASVLDDLEIRQKWDIRVFEERESQKNYLCEQAVLLEQRFFLLGRNISASLESEE